MSELRYTEDHEWVRVEGDTATVGISAYAQEQMGDVVFVELPEPGRALAQGDEAAVVESVKAASEVYSPLTGEVAEANPALEETPGLVNEAPTGEGWLFKVKLAEPGEVEGLMDAQAYDTYLAGL